MFVFHLKLHLRVEGFALCPAPNHLMTDIGCDIDRCGISSE
jgi:hypothetical protein